MSFCLYRLFLSRGLLTVSFMIMHVNVNIASSVRVMRVMRVQMRVHVVRVMRVMRVQMRVHVVRVVRVFGVGRM